MIAFAAVAVALAVACQIDEPSRPALPTVSRTVAPFDADSIHLTYVCGKRFRIRNENDFAADVTWDVVGSADSGRLTLPARPAGQPYSEVYISTNSIGLTRLRYQSQIIETSINVGTPCVVPALAPPTIPYALLLSLGQIDIGRGRRARPDVVMVVFRDGTPQSIRQAAVDAVGGLVVGGYPLVFRENAYYVLVPGQGTLKGLLDAVEILRALPAVSQAGFIDDDPGGGAAYRRPNDGGGFQEGNWRVSKQNADSTNWALEAIDAPLAWGCDTGTATVKVAVVDRSYTPGTEVDNNVAFPGYLPNAFGDNHGLRVASVLGAPGNNSAGITGIMWAVAIDFRERLADPNNYLQPMQRLPMVTVDDIILTEHLVAAGDAGAHIINLSLSNEWVGAPDTSATNDTTRRDRDDIRAAAQSVREAIATLRGRQRFPLFVISAGNDGLDARYSGYNHARLDYPDQVIIVGGSKRGSLYNDTIAGPSNWGSLVDIYAPGNEVASLVPNQTVYSGGTSFAAPLVAGTAGLVRSFDPRPYESPRVFRRARYVSAPTSTGVV